MSVELPGAARRLTGMRAFLSILTLVALTGCAASGDTSSQTGAADQLPVSEVPSPAASEAPPATGGGEVLCPEPAGDGDLTAVDAGCQPPDQQPKAEVVTPRPGMVNVAPIPWVRAEPTGDGTTLRVTWTSGVEPCYVLDHVVVEEAPDAVTVTLFQGSDPAAGTAVCIEIATDKTVEVQLSAPLGDRPVLDGSQT
jgi:hypothetical protein